MCFVCVHACAYVHMYVCAHTNVITKQEIVCIVINVNIFIRAYQYYKVSLIRSNIRVEIQFKNCYLLVCVVMILLEEIEVGTSNSILQYLNDCVYCLILFGICRLENMCYTQCWQFWLCSKEDPLCSKQQICSSHDFLM